MLNRPKPVALLILDGFGYSLDKECNAIAMADTPCWDKLQADCPTTLLSCSGAVVGLPGGQMGNSEVGRIGIMDAAILAMEVADALKSLGGQMLVTADHGNIEQMVDKKTEQPHTTNLVPLVYVGGDRPLDEGGSLSDLAPTMLVMLGVEQPAEMTGRSLVKFV